jgi:hypothetical protein
VCVCVGGNSRKLICLFTYKRMQFIRLSLAAASCVGTIVAHCPGTEPFFPDVKCITNKGPVLDAPEYVSKRKREREKKKRKKETSTATMSP